MSKRDLSGILTIFEGSDAHATIGLYDSAERGAVGADYPGERDGVKNMSATRICRFVADLFARAPA